MRDPNAYFSSFIPEAQQILAGLRLCERRLTTPARQRERLEADFAETQRLGHALGGLAATMQLDDLALLGTALEDTLTQLSPETTPARAIGIPMMYVTVYLDGRIARMISAGRVLPADRGEQAEAERITMMLRALAPPETAPRLADDDDLHLPPELRQVVQAFLDADLSTSAISAATSAMPAVTGNHIAAFIDEMSDDVARLQRLAVGLRAGEELPLATLTEMNEVAHSLKGAAYFVRAMVTGNLCEMMETLLGAVRQGYAPFTGDVVRWLLAACENLEGLKAYLTTDRTDARGAALLHPLHEGFARIMTAASDLPAPRSRTAPSSGQSETPPIASTLRVTPESLERLMNAIDRLQINDTQADRHQADATGSEQEIRLTIMRLTELHDRLRSERIEYLTKPYPVYDPIAMMQEPRATPMPPALSRYMEQKLREGMARPENLLAVETYSEFDLLMDLLGEVIRDLRFMHTRLETALSRTRRQHQLHMALTRQAQREVLSLRQVPLATLIPRLQIVARTTADQEGKEVTFIAAVDDVLLDGEIASALVDPLVQTVRNAVAHGLESLVTRRDAGKLDPPAIHMVARSDTDGVTIAISDNGHGINHEQIIAAALLVQGPDGPLLTEEQAHALTREEAFALMFLPDVSTAFEVRPSAGRGMGLPSVKRVIEQIGGSVSVSSELGQGTTFFFRVPSSPGLIRAINVRAASGRFAIPFTDFARATLVEPEQCFLAEDGTAFARVPDLLGNAQTMPIIALSDLLGREQEPVRGRHVVIVGVDRQMFAVTVDEVGEISNMIVRRTPAYLRRRGISGVTLTQEGEGLAVLDLPMLLRHAMREGTFRQRLPAIAPREAAAPQGNYILVVDDSPSIRQSLERLLTGAGYEVQEARDGLDAVHHITRLRPRLIILDIEMPRMNGYEFLEVLRAQPPDQRLHAVMLTSRAAPRHRARAFELGAVEYLVKPVRDDVLLAAVALALDAIAAGEIFP
jgi:chemotaxis protein histidine kinase CheA/CheY-like chemotaxis protein